MKIRVSVPAEICMTVEVDDESQIEAAVDKHLMEELHLYEGTTVHENTRLYTNPLDGDSYKRDEIEVLFHEDEK